MVRLTQSMHFAYESFQACTRGLAVAYNAGGDRLDERLLTEDDIPVNLCDCASNVRMLTM